MNFSERTRMILQAIGEQIENDEELLDDLGAAIAARDFDFIESLVEAAFEALGWAFDAIGSFIGDVFQSVKSWLSC